MTLASVMKQFKANEKFNTSDFHKYLLSLIGYFLCQMTKESTDSTLDVELVEYII